MPKRKKFIIKDWAGNIKFKGKTFGDFESAYDWLGLQIEKLYPETKTDETKYFEEIGEFYVDEE